MTELQTIPPNNFAISIPAAPHFSHIVVFMLPGQQLPPETAAAIYLQFPGQNEFKILGAIGNEKQSAIFKVTLPDNVVDSPGAVVNLGITVDAKASIEAQVASSARSSTNSTAMTLANRPTPQASTKLIAQRIIKNAFNFIASFSGDVNGTEAVPLKAFENWWKKFESRIDSDPSFLDRDVQD